MTPAEWQAIRDFLASVGLLVIGAAGILIFGAIVIGKLDGEICQPEKPTETPEKPT
jgi:hypothetical protein